MSRRNLMQNALIIGAGAHVPYGFPTSRGLTTKLREMLRDDAKVSFLRRETSIPSLNNIPTIKNDLVRLALKYNFISPAETPNSSNEHEVNLGNSLYEFTKSFCESGVYSIDSYLSKLTETKGQQDEDSKLKSKWGRLILAYLLWLYEVQHPFGSHEDDWVEYIINNYIKDNYKTFFAEPPKIITFNYDRFLERRLFKHLTEFQGLDDIKAEELVNNLEIIHVYGDLGSFTKWPTMNDESFIKEAMERVQVIGESRSNSKLNDVKSEIYNKLSRVNKIYFLGYGFDEQNNKILFERFDRDELKEFNFYSTNIGINGSDISRINQSLKFLPQFLQKNENKEVTSLNLLNELMPLDRIKNSLQVSTIPFR